jgi:tetratricopeptide (TPR) repeat protein
MRFSKLVLLSLSLSLAWASAASAEDKPKKKTGEEATREKDSKDKKDDKPGTKGISPYTEKLLKGHKLVAARDFAGAVEAYRSAVAEDDKNAQGHYFLGAAQLLKGDMTEAEASWQNAIRIAPQDTVMQSKVRFGLADLRERQRRLEDGKVAWQDYGKFIADNPKVTGYPNTPGERQKATDRWLELERKYGEVKARIAAREQEQKDKRDKDAARDAAEEEKKGGKKK